MALARRGYVPVAIALWAVIVLVAGLVFGGGRVAPCFGLYDAQTACVAAWDASHPAPPAIFDIALPWPWIELFFIGLIIIVAIDRLRARRKGLGGIVGAGIRT